MAYTRHYRTIIPLEPGGDPDVLRWLARESFERKADGDCLRIVDWQETQLAPEEIPPKAGKQLGRPVADYDWFAFSATATSTAVASA